MIYSSKAKKSLLDWKGRKINWKRAYIMMRRSCNPMFITMQQGIYIYIYIYAAF